MKAGPVQPRTATGPGQARWPVPGHRWRPHSDVPDNWWPDVAILAGCLLVSGLLLWPSPLVQTDVALRDLGQVHQVPGWYYAARALNFLGQGSPLAVICAGLAGWIAWTFRTVRPLCMFAAVYLGLGAVLLVKNVLDRVAPRYPEPGQPPYVDAAGAVLFGPGDGASFPSGHGANTAVWYGLAVLLAGAALTRWQRLVLLASPPLIVLACQTYLGFHWVSDTPVGYLLGLELLRLVRRVPWERLIPPRWDVNRRR